MRWAFWRKPKEETRAAMSGFTAELMAARESYISGRRGIAELTGTVQSCVSLWENGLRVADVDGTDLLTGNALGMIGRALIATVCGKDPARLRALGGRFSAPVYPGETLRTALWRDGSAVWFETRAVDRDIVVLANGRAELKG